MANFDFFKAKFFANRPFKGIHRLERTPFQGFVDQEYLTVQEIFFGVQKLGVCGKYTDLSPNAPRKSDEAHNQTVNGKIGKFALAHQFDHPCTGGQSSDKGSNKSRTHGHSLVAMKGNFPSHQIFGHFAQDQRNYH